MMCMHRTADGKCLKFTVPPVIFFCVDGPCPDEQLSNADRIRNMSDEELAAILVAESLAEKIPFCQNKAECNEILDTADGTITEEMCLKCALDWLRKPAKEATHE